VLNKKIAPKTIHNIDMVVVSPCITEAAILANVIFQTKNASNAVIASVTGITRLEGY